MSAICKARYRPYATNLAANVLASKMSLDENAINVLEVTLASRIADAVKRKVQNPNTGFRIFPFYISLFYLIGRDILMQTGKMALVRESILLALSLRTYYF